MTLGAVAFAAPAVCGAIIAVANSDSVNNWTEKVETLIRRWDLNISARTGWFLSYVVHSLLWLLVKFFDRTDALDHRGIKNGSRIAIGLYMITAWLTLIYFTTIIVLGLMLTALVFYVAFKILEASGTISNTAMSERVSSVHEGYSRMRDSRTFRKTGMFSADETGRTDEEGRIFRKTGLFSEEEIGRVAEDGTIHRKTGMFSEEETGRIDGEGRIFRKTGMFSEVETDRVDKDGVRYKKLGLFSEDEVGWHEHNEQ